MAGNIRIAGRSVKELRIHLCQSTPQSQGVRDFITTHYVPMKQANPQLPILVRECGGVTPRIWARYDFGRERSMDLENKTKEDVLKIVQELVDVKG